VDSLRILHVVHCLGQRAAGLGAFVSEVAAAQNRKGHRADVRAWWPDGCPVWRRPRALAATCRAIWSAVERAEIVHIHGLWSGASWVGGHSALMRRRAYVVSPHGMLDAWALRRSRWKKRIARLLLEDRILSRATCIHALCEAEQEAIRVLGLGAPVVVVRPGLDRGSLSLVSGEMTTRQRRYVLYLGRLHPKKGVDLLIEAFATVAWAHPEWQLVIAGPDEVGVRTDLERGAREAGLQRRVEFVGAVSGEGKRQLLEGASIFALTSYSEGVPIAVLEAMGAGVPALVTRDCNLPEITMAGAGHVVALTRADIARGLDRLLSGTESDRAEMGTRARRLVERQFTSDRMVDRFDFAYRWALGRGPTPPEMLLQGSCHRGSVMS